MNQKTKDVLTFALATIAVVALCSTSAGIWYQNKILDRAYGLLDTRLPQKNTCP